MSSVQNEPPLQNNMLLHDKYKLTSVKARKWTGNWGMARRIKIYKDAETAA